MIGYIWRGGCLVVACLLLSITPAYSLDLCTSEWTLMRGMMSEGGNQTDLMDLEECLVMCEGDEGCLAVDFMSSLSKPCRLHTMSDYLDRQTTETLSNQYRIKRACVPEEDPKLSCPPTWSLQMKKRPQLVRTQGEATTHATLASCFNYCRLTPSCHAVVHDIEVWPPCQVFNEAVVTFTDDSSSNTYLFEHEDNCTDPSSPTTQHTMGSCTNERFPQTHAWCPAGTKVSPTSGSFKINPLCCGKSSSYPLDSSSLSSFNINDLEFKKIKECLSISNCTFEATSFTRSYITNPFCLPKTSTNYVSISYQCLGKGVTLDIPAFTPTPILTHKAFPGITKNLISKESISDNSITTGINPFLTSENPPTVNESGSGKTDEPLLTPPSFNQTEASKSTQQTDPVVVTTKIPPQQTDPVIVTTKIPPQQTDPIVVTTKIPPQQTDPVVATLQQQNGTEASTTPFVRNTPMLLPPLTTSPNSTFVIITPAPPIIQDGGLTTESLSTTPFPPPVTTKTPKETNSSSVPVPSLSPPIQVLSTKMIQVDPLNRTNSPTTKDSSSTTPNILGVVTTTPPMPSTPLLLPLLTTSSNSTFVIITPAPPIIPDEGLTIESFSKTPFPQLVTTKTPKETNSSSVSVFVPTLSPPVQVLPTITFQSNPPNPLNHTIPPTIKVSSSTTLNILGVVTTTYPLTINPATTPKVIAVKTDAKENKTALILGAIGTTFGILCLLALLGILYLVVYNTRKQSTDQWSTELMEKKHSPNQNYIGTSVA